MIEQSAILILTLKLRYEIKQLKFTNVKLILKYCKLNLIHASALSIENSPLYCATNNRTFDENKSCKTLARDIYLVSQHTIKKSVENQKQKEAERH